MHFPIHHTLPHIPDEYINVDLFAGGGGASLGMEMAGYRVHAAVNHNPQAVAIHAINHPHTEHWVQDIYTVSPRQVTRGRRVGWLWASPDCTHHSKAKGGPPIRNARRRELAMVLVDKWLPELGDKRPLGIALENVEEFEDWGPLDRHGLVTVMLDGHPWVIADIGMRMLKPRELARGNGFPDWYVIERGADGKPVTQQAQVAMIGNSVPPDFARALLQANPLRYPERVEMQGMPLLEAMA